MFDADESFEPSTVRRLLEPSEDVHIEARASDALVLVTDRRVAVATRHDRFDLDIPYEGLRRVQFDIERTRPAVLVIVPERPADAPQVLSIPPDQYEVVGKALAVIGQRLYPVSPQTGHDGSSETTMDASGDGEQVFGG